MSQGVSIQIADSDAEVAACFPVLHQLRPHLEQDNFLAHFRQLQASDRYQLVSIKDSVGKIVAVAGYTIYTNLAFGRHLYLQDLVTADSERSKGYGKLLIDWLRQHAKEQDCSTLHLCSKFERQDAHRFYEREGIEKLAYHFCCAVSM